MLCHHCEKEIQGDIKEWSGGIYDLGKTIKGDGDFTFSFHPQCLPLFVGERARWFDDLDEVMNANKYFQRTKGMEGSYEYNNESFPVSAYWKRGDIEYNYTDAPSRFKNEKIVAFQKWLQERNFKYEYEHR